MLTISLALQCSFRSTRLAVALRLEQSGESSEPLVLGLLAGLSSFILDQEVFYVTIARKLGLMDPQFSGWLVHFVVGLVAGAVFIGTMAVIKRFALDTRKKSFWVGLLGE